jgi:1-aminocyclopropane-1-carboxylate deaminase/D-cysteine desulfhydrase-like pyridoxal-dependent ACC family enzyme
MKQIELMNKLGQALGMEFYLKRDYQKAMVLFKNHGNFNMAKVCEKAMGK